MRRELDPLAFAAGQPGQWLPQPEVVEADVDDGVQDRRYRAVAGKELQCLADCHLQDVADRFVVEVVGEDGRPSARSDRRADPDTSALPRSGMRIGEVAAYLGVRTSALRVWESAGLLAPQRDPGTKYRRFSQTDVRDARMINMLRQGGYSFPLIRPILDGLRHTGSSEALRAAIAQRQAALTRRAAAMLEGFSHLHHYVIAEEPAPSDENPAVPHPRPTQRKRG